MLSTLNNLFPKKQKFSFFSKNANTNSTTNASNIVPNVQITSSSIIQPETIQLENQQNHLKQYIIDQPTDLTFANPINLYELWQKASARYSSNLLEFLKNLPPVQLKTILNSVDSNGKTLLCAAVENLINLKVHDILSLYPDDASRLEAIKVSDYKGNTPLHQAAIHDSNVFVTLLELYPNNTEQLQAISTQNKEHYTVVHYAVRNKNSTACTIIFLLCDQPYLTGLLNVESEEGLNILETAAYYNNPLTIIKILKKFPENQRLSLLNRPASLELSALKLAVYLHPEVFNAIFDALPTNQYCEALITKDKFDESIFHHAVLKPKMLSIIFNRVSVTQLIIILNEILDEELVQYNTTQIISTCKICLLQKLNETGAQSTKYYPYLERKIDGATRLYELLNPALLYSIQALTFASLDEQLRLFNELNSYNPGFLFDDRDEDEDWHYSPMK